MEWDEMLDRAERSARHAVLATVIGTQGHAYRKEGAAMVMLASGESFGIVSPGCLEDDLAARVPEVLSTGKPETVAYDMRSEEDPIWGEAVGCGGKIVVLLEPLRGRLLMLLRRARRWADRGVGTVLERRRVGDEWHYRLVPLEGETVRVRPDTRGVADVAGLAAGTEAPGAGVLISATAFRPRPRLIVFGAGRDAPPLCELAARVGFRVVVADWRERYLSAERFAGASLLICGTPDKIAAKLGANGRDYAVVCSHHLRRDREMLELLLPAEPAYIGVMGSRKRIALLFEGLRRTPNVHAPVGMAIGAEGPEEIAVSIAAELIMRKAAIASVAVAKGAMADADCRIVLGGGQGQPNGRAQAVR